MKLCLVTMLASVPAVGLSASAQCELQHFFHVTETDEYAVVQPQLGTALAIHGERMLAGAPGEGMLSDGAVLVLDRVAGTWIETARLQAAAPPGCPTHREFGCDVDLQGDRALVGARGTCVGGLHGAGGAYVFQRGPLGWTTVSALAPSTPEEWGGFGTSVALAGDTAFVGAARNIGFPVLDNAVYVFERFPTGHWSERQKLVSPNPGANLFGHDIATDGNVLLVGEPGVGDGSFRGSVSVFERIAGQWVMTQEVLPPSAVTGGFGFSIALDEVDGTRALIGAARSAHVFERGPAGWTLVQELVPRGPSSPYFGFAVALSGDIAVVGDAGAEDFVDEAGTAWLFVRTPAGWQERGELPDPSPREYERCGASTAASADGTVIVGIPGDHVGVRQDQGSVLVWDTSALGCVTLAGAPDHVSLSAGGVQDFRLQAPPSYAGDIYLLLASERGTSPGIRFSTVLLPLNPGAALSYSLRFPNSPPFASSLGRLDARAEASASFTVPPLSDASLVGLELHFAFVTLRPGGALLPPSGASDATVLEFRQ